MVDEFCVNVLGKIEAQVFDKVFGGFTYVCFSRGTILTYFGVINIVGHLLS